VGSDDSVLVFALAIQGKNIKKGKDIMLTEKLTIIDFYRDCQ
jgi:hypothetical protein